jgi:hypothetical protein
VVSGAHGLLRGFFLPAYINGYLFGLYAQIPMEEVLRQLKDGVLSQLFGCVLGVMVRGASGVQMQHARKRTTG